MSKRAFNVDVNQPTRLCSTCRGHVSALWGKNSLCDWDNFLLLACLRLLRIWHTKDIVARSEKDRCVYLLRMLRLIHRDCSLEIHIPLPLVSCKYFPWYRSYSEKLDRTESLSIIPRREGNLIYWLKWHCRKDYGAMKKLDSCRTKLNFPLDAITLPPILDFGFRVVDLWIHWIVAENWKIFPLSAPFRGSLPTSTGEYSRAVYLVPTITMRNQLSAIYHGAFNPFRSSTRTFRTGLPTRLFRMRGRNSLTGSVSSFGANETVPVFS